MSSLPLPIAVPSGYGFRHLSVPELKERANLLDLLLIFEPPRTGPAFRDYRYVISADVSDGIGLDRSSVDVIRLGTVEEPEEQVAHFLSNRRTPTQLAHVIDALGHLYLDSEQYEALVAVELNNHGLSTQDTLQLHLGYTHFYRWEVLDSADPRKRFTPRIGWSTTPRTRPIILDKLFEAVTALDPISGLPDLRVNSSFTIDEMADFQTEGALWEAEAARGAHDDCILSLSIGHYVAWKLAGGEREPVNERRRRKIEQDARAKVLSEQPRDWRNSAFTTDELAAGDLSEEWVDEDTPGYRVYR